MPSNKWRLQRQSSKFLSAKKRQNALLAVLVAVSLFSWLFALSKFTYLSAFAIQAVNLEGADHDIADSLKAAALGAVQGDYFGMFSKTNDLIYPRRAVAKAVLSASSRLERVEVRRQGLNSLAISVREKAPAALVCDDLPDFASATRSSSDSANNAEDCYFVDGSGTVFMRAPDYSANVYNRYFVPNLGDQASSTEITGAKAMAEGVFTALQKFYETARANGIKPTGVLVKDGGEYEMYASNSDAAQAENATTSLSDATVIYFNEHNGLENELSNLVSFWSHMQDAARAKKQVLAFDYLDLRYGSNVFYRLK